MHLFVYLHGFKSSPFSNKAQLTKVAIEKRIQLGEQITWYCPQLPASPREAIAMVREHIDGQTFSATYFVDDNVVSEDEWLKAISTKKEVTQ